MNLVRNTCALDTTPSLRHRLYCTVYLPVIYLYTVGRGTVQTRITRNVPFVLGHFMYIPVAPLSLRLNCCAACRLQGIVKRGNLCIGAECKDGVVRLPTSLVVLFVVLVIIIPADPAHPVQCGDRCWYICTVYTSVYEVRCVCSRR